MTSGRKDAAAAWNRVPPADRREVYRLANAGEPHPDEVVRAAAYAWCHDEHWNRVWNRVPGWLLPAVGLLGVVLVIVTGLPALLAVGFTFVTFCGLMGWAGTASALRLRRVYR
jgi:hypothetical protein